jgi:hypothetical protein
MTITKIVARLPVMPTEGKTLTLKLDLRTLAEFAVAAKLSRARSVSSFLHNYVVNQINEARHSVTADEWDRLVEEQERVTMERSRAKADLVKKYSGPATLGAALKDQLVTKEAESERMVNGNVEPVPDERVVYVRNLGELTDERKQKPIRKRAGKGK